MNKAKLSSDEVSAWKLGLLALLAVGAGFLAFNFSHIMKVSHIHLSLAHSHRTTAFCAFAGCRLTDNLEDAPKVVPEKTAESIASAGVVEAAVSPVTAGSRGDEPDPPASEDTVNALKARVCGSPAIDGYAHVVPKCLEESPTAIWWRGYYLSGGKQKDLVVHIEKGADYDGLAVAWGLGNKKESAEECAMQCLEHMPGKVDGPFKNLPCNAFSWCAEDVCFVPDAHHHTKGDCWIKFTEGPAYPEINMRGDLPPEFRKRHPNAPNTVQWWGGVLLPRGVQPTNGTYGPRFNW